MTGNGTRGSAFPRATAVAALTVALAAPARGEAPAPRRDDPRLDGWASEAFQGEAGSRLGEVLHLLEGEAPPDARALAAFLAEGFACGPLVPVELAPRFDDGLFAVAGGTVPGGVVDGCVGAAGLAGELARLAGLAHGLGERHAKVKVVGVELGDGTATTEQLVAFTAHGPVAAAEVHARWVASWDVASQPPRLTALHGAGDVEVSRLRGARALFTDVSESALAPTGAVWREQLLRGTWSWLGELEGGLGTDFMGHSGIAVGDVDGDGLEDVYLPQMGGLPNRLLLHRPDGTVVERAAWAGVDWLDRTHGALLVDLDGDADLDLALSATSAVVVMENDGRGRFRVRALHAEARYAYSLAAADYDADGDLDLYACRYSPLGDDPEAAGSGSAADIPVPVPYHDAENGARNVLLRNDGDFRFADATAETGLEAANRRWSFAAAWEDYDDDGDPDLYVANDFGRNALYRNDGAAAAPRFVEVAAAAGVEDLASGMSAAWGDYDRDGRMDLYVGNMFSSAGHRVTGQAAFQPDMPLADRRAVRGMARGNTLLRNRGDGTFEDTSVQAGVTLGRWAWSSQFADLNLDGLEDLVVANGFLTATDADDL